MVALEELQARALSLEPAVGDVGCPGVVEDAVGDEALVDRVAVIVEFGDVVAERREVRLGLRSEDSVEVLDGGYRSWRRQRPGLDTST